jgi:hypothetical protein
VALGVEPGIYEVRVERDKTSLLAKSTVGDGARLVIDRTQFGPARLEPTRARGEVLMPHAVDGRNRLELRLGMFLTGASGTLSTGLSTGGIAGGLEYRHYLTESVAVTLGVEGTELRAGSAVGPGGVFSDATALAAIPVGVRWYPLALERRTDAVKPFIAGGIGPIIGETLGSIAGGSAGMSGGEHTTATVGGYVRGGADFHLGRSFTLGVDGGYNWMADFAQPVGLESGYRGFGIGVGVGWLFGRGTADRP